MGYLSLPFAIQLNVSALIQVIAFYAMPDPIDVLCPYYFSLLSFPLKCFFSDCRCVAVLQGRNFQDNIINTSRKAITALAFSADGRYLALGEV